MIALYILLGIVLFFALLFSMKIKVYVRLTDELRLRAGFGPVLLTLVPKKKKAVSFLPIASRPGKHWAIC